MPGNMPIPYRGKLRSNRGWRTWERIKVGMHIIHIDRS